jgi:hypothetical protein
MCIRYQRCSLQLGVLKEWNSVLGLGSLRILEAGKSWEAGEPCTGDAYGSYHHIQKIACRCRVRVQSPSFGSPYFDFLEAS